MAKEVKNIDPAYDFEAPMPLARAIPLGLQHVLAMFVGNLTPLLIICGACGIAGAEFAVSVKMGNFREILPQVGRPQFISFKS